MTPSPGPDMEAQYLRLETGQKEYRIWLLVLTVSAFNNIEKSKLLISF